MDETIDIKLDRLFNLEEDRPVAKTEIVKVNSNYDDRGFCLLYTSDAADE